MFNSLKKIFSTGPSEKNYSLILKNLSSKELSTINFVDMFEKIDPVFNYSLMPAGLGLTVKFKLALFHKGYTNKDLPLAAAIALVKTGVGLSSKSFKGKIFIKIKKGTIESEFEKGNLKIKFNDKVIANIDLIDKKIINLKNQQIGSFGKKDVFIGAENDFNVTLNDKIVCSITSSTRNMFPNDKFLFENVTPKLTDEEKVILLALEVFDAFTIKIISQHH